jgi:hypothetical protein
MLDVAKVVLCLVPWVCSLIATDSQRAVQAERAPHRMPVAISARAAAQEVDGGCRAHHCSLPGDTASRVVRFSYVPEIIRTADDL